ncbi:NADH-quinone oxidoreductase subunit J [Natronogracilivirga saccharolytica]|uniref:NADH-quinone oxidoreductase subunit J n=1 Tax=Natronogracilivirga saccharolytica TaxID=2812953 RepID=A0A8J7RJ73_9BACT|nr:NADH-quinone oxidoreductase subunit J [Natronogracilivirga saccharolytica]MBP3192217.1 NADH-quinone oxidoreductase subunit J [Natronogracilivirga saccharolytica]
MESYIFVLFATLAVAAAIGMITSRDTVNSALFLVLNLISVAGIFLLLKAQFLAVVQVLVYGGAIMVLFLFVIMLLNLSDEENLLSRLSVKYILAFFLGVIVLAQLLYAISSYTGTLPDVSAEIVQIGTVESIGDALFNIYILPVLVTAMLLTAAVVGALLLAQRKLSDKKPND